MEQHLQQEEENRYTAASSMTTESQQQTEATTNTSAISEAEREATLARLLKQAKKQKQLERLWYGISLSVIALVLLGNRVAPIAVIMPLTLLGILVAPIAVIIARTRWGNAASALAEFDDVRAVGPLLEALKHSDAAVVIMAKYALADLLPRLKASDAALLTAEQRKILYSKLTMPNAQDPWAYWANLPISFFMGKKIRKRFQRVFATPDFLLAVLKAVEQIGDEQAIPYVQILAANRVRGERGRRVREAAEECLKFLGKRVEERQNWQTLLRASSGEAFGTDTLLRAASGVAETDPQQLLRASEE